MAGWDLDPAAVQGAWDNADELSRQAQARQMEHDQAAQLAAALGGIPIEQARLIARSRRGQGLSATPLPEVAKSGRYAVAASPLEFLATAMQRVRGNSMQNEADQGSALLAQQQAAGMGAQYRQDRADKDRSFGLLKTKTDAQAELDRAHADFYRTPKPLAATRPGSEAFAKDRAPADPRIVTWLAERGVELPPDATNGQADHALRIHLNSGQKVGTVTEVQGPDGAPVKVEVLPRGKTRTIGRAPEKERAPKSIAQDVRTHLSDYAGESEAFADLGARFKPEFSGGGLAGEARIGAKRKLGSSDPDVAWWADYERLINLPARNKVFGASLSAGEKASWQQAQNIRPGASPELVQQTIAKLQAIIDSKGRGLIAGQVKEGFPEDALHEYSRSRFKAQEPAAPAAPGARVRTYNPVTGQLE